MRGVSIEIFKSESGSEFTASVLYELGDIVECGDT